MIYNNHHAATNHKDVWTCLGTPDKREGLSKGLKPCVVCVRRVMRQWKEC